MKKLFILCSLFLAYGLSAKMLISPMESMKSSFGESVSVVKKNIMIKKSEAKKISKDAQVKLDSKIFRIYMASKDNEVLGYGVLINKKVRSKNAAILYIIDKNSDSLKSIEIIAFNEPMEYLPTSKWNTQFVDTNASNRPRLGKDIATITGATLSARTITDASRLALSFYENILKGKE